MRSKHLLLSVYVLYYVIFYRHDGLVYGLIHGHLFKRFLLRFLERNQLCTNSTKGSHERTRNKVRRRTEKGIYSREGFQDRKWKKIKKKKPFEKMKVPNSVVKVCLPRPLKKKTRDPSRDVSC